MKESSSNLKGADSKFMKDFEKAFNIWLYTFRNETGAI